MDTLLQDVRYAVRQLAKSPGFTLPAVLTLALGIGANTAFFSVVDGVLLRPTPFDDVGRLMMIWETDRKSGTTREPASVPDYLDFRRLTKQFGQVAAFAAREVTLTPEGGDPSRLAALAVSHEFLPMVGVRPLVGRTFTAAEDRPGGPRVVLIGAALWEQLFSRDPAVVGRTIRIDDVARTIVGVLPDAADFGALQILGAAAYSRGFADRGGRARVDVWAPLQPDPATTPRETHPIFLVGRLGPGASVSLAQQELGAVAAELERTYPENDARGVHVESLAQVVFGPVRPALLVLLGAVALVLLVACANVANLLLARGAARRREITVRTAMGASGRRLAQQFLIESAVLATVGALAGVAIASAALDALLALAPASIPRVASVGLDARVLAVTLAVTIMVAFVFGLMPTLQARNLDLQASLQGEPGRGASTGREQRRFRSALVVVELTLAVMLMAGAGLLIKSLWRLQQVDPGFRATGVLKAEFQLPASRYPQDFSNWPNWREIGRLTDELRHRVAALPGVEAVTVAGNHPLDAGFTSSIQVVGREAEAADWPEPSIRRVDPGYLATLHVPLVAGRPFEETDVAGSTPVILINEAAKRRFFSDGHALGQRIRLWGAERMVVGVIGDERLYGLAEATPPAVYLPTTQVPSSSGSLLVRVNRDPAALAPTIRRIVRDLDPALPLFGVEPLRQTLVNTLGQRRFTMIVLGVFAAVALLLAVVGVHGVLSYTVAQRTREIGIRMALGADLRDVRSLIVSQGARLAGWGLALGLVGALVVTRVLSTLLYGVRADDPGTFAGVALALGAVALLASYLPARRATKVSPMLALRSE
ncbi:MAG: ABC transporter permease [Gemmatimonadales bacterium]